MSRVEPMMCCAAAAALLACASGASGGGTRAGWSHANAVVSFSYEAVDPETARITPEGNLSWRNTDPETRGFVVFPASIASHFRCADLHPYFSKSGEVYRSLPIEGTDSERVQLPCSLAPGSYDYEIWIEGSGLGSEEDDDAPQQVLRATIVVEPGSR